MARPRSTPAAARWSSGCGPTWAPRSEGAAMASFIVGQQVPTATASVAVDPGLKPGFHRFRLVVVDDAGLASQPDEQVVQVIDQVVQPVPTGPILVNPNPIGPVVTPLPPLRRPQ